MTRSERVRRVSRLMRLICTLAIFVIPLGLAGLWATFDLWAASHPELMHLGKLARPMPAPILLSGFLISMIPGSIALFAVWRLRRLFGLYAGGEIFTAGNVRCLRDFALAVMGLALAKPVTGALLSVVLTLANPPGQRQLAIQFGSSEVTTLFVGGVFLTIAWVMDAGREMAEDSARIV